MCLKRKSRPRKRQTAAAKDSIAKQMADLEAKQVTLTDRLEELKKEQEELATRVDEDLLDRFNRLFASKGDAAVVALGARCLHRLSHENHDANGGARKRRQRDRELRAMRPDSLFRGVGRGRTGKSRGRIEEIGIFSREPAHAKFSFFLHSRLILPFFPDFGPSRIVRSLPDQTLNRTPLRRHP